MLAKSSYKILYVFDEEMLLANIVMAYGLHRVYYLWQTNELFSKASKLDTCAGYKVFTIRSLIFRHTHKVWDAATHGHLIFSRPVLKNIS
jgi:hypothetical protein